MKKNDHYIELTHDFTEHDEAVSDGRSVIEFCSPSSGSSHIMSSMFEELAAAYHEKTSFFRVDMDNLPDAGARFGVRSIPCFVFLAEGTIVNRIYGVTSRSEIESAIEDLITA